MMQGEKDRMLKGMGLVLVVGLILLGALPSSAAAQEPVELWTHCETGSGAGQCVFPRGIAADPKSGHIFIADQNNVRIVELTARGQFVKAWGWDVVEGGGAEFEICLPGDTCQAGSEGAGAGQFGSFGPQGLAVDSAGNVYVVDYFNQRVEKFDSEGNFLFSFGGEGIGNGQFSWSSGIGVSSFIAVDRNGTETAADDKVYVGDVDRIQRFDVNGAYQAQIALPGKIVRLLAVDTAGKLYAGYNQNDIHKLDPVSGEELLSFPMDSPNAVAVDDEGHVYAFGVTKVAGIDRDPLCEFAPSGSLIECFGKGQFTASTGLATNLCPEGEEPGNLYVSNSTSSPSFVRAYGPEPTTCGKAITEAPSPIAETAATLRGKANPSGEEVTECLFEYGTTQAYGQSTPCAESSGEIGEGSKPVAVHADIAGLQKGTVYHVRLVVGTAAGSELGSDEVFKTLGPPVLSGEGTFSVAYTEATLKALVNPEGFPTSYHFEYGTDTTYGHSTASIAVGSPGDRSEHKAQVNLAGLEPGTTYHWRIVASNSSGTTEGLDQVFTTYSEPTPQSCPNDAFRTEAGAALPDCRAYEMVSPVDKNGGDADGAFFAQSTPEGEKIVYSAGPAFGDVETNVSSNDYLANRGDTGWSSRAIHPPKFGERPISNAIYGFTDEFEGFTPDLCSAWFLDVMTPPLTDEGQEGFFNHYRLDLCHGEEPEALTTVPPPPGSSEVYVDGEGLAVAGFSDDARHAFFSAKAKLTERAAANTKAQLYDHYCPVAPSETCKEGGTKASLHLVSIRPPAGKATTGNADPGDTAVGNTSGFNVDNAVSEDGSRVYWTSIQSDGTGIGQIFLREHPERDGAGEGECETRAQACTVAVAGSALIGAFFWTAASDGSAALYSEEAGNFEAKPFEDGLFAQRFEASETKKLKETKLPRELVAQHVEGAMGASEDLSRIYLVSTDALTGGQENSAGEKAQAGQPNLYLDEGGVKTFIATLDPRDVGKGTLNEERAYDVVSNFSKRRAARVSPDGAQIAFQSRAPLTGFNNTDPASGEPLVEVFTYEAGGALHCVSCNPSGARPSGRELVVAGIGSDVFASAWIPALANIFVSPSYFSRPLSNDGGRLFFNSYEALIPADTNGAMDVYEWERPGTGSCSADSHAFHAANGGCLYLISSGTSPTDSRFVDASADGSDAFFSTKSSLLPQDPGLVDVYDARVEGGFPPPPPPAAPCEGEACQTPPPPPALPTPSSRTYKGPGDVVQGTARCPKGKHRVRRKGKVRCVARHKGRAHGKRGAGR